MWIGRFQRRLMAGLHRVANFDFEGALFFFEQASALRPKDPRVHLHLGKAFSEAGRYDEAVEALETARMLGPDSAVFPLFLGITHLDHLCPDRAGPVFQEALEKDGKNYLIKNYAALAEWDQGAAQQAVEIFLNLDFLQAPPFESRLLLRVEKRLAGKQEGDSPLSCPPSPPLSGGWLKTFRGWQKKRWLKQASRQMQENRHESACAILEKIADYFPGDGAVRKDLAQARKQRLKDLQKGVKKGSENREQLLERSCLLIEIRAFDEAEACLDLWQQSLAKGAGEEEPAYACEYVDRLLAEIAVEKGQLDKAAHQLDKLRATHALDDYAAYLQGRLSLLKDQPFAARRAMERFLDKEPAFARYRLQELFD